MKERTVIIGAGIAGLTCAAKLHESGFDVTLLEQSSQVGGCIRTVTREGYQLELGPNTFLNSSKALWQLAGSVGIGAQKIETKPEVGKKRYIYSKERLHAIPAGPKLLFSPVMSVRGRLRILKEPFIKPHRLPDPSRDESLASFISRRFGREVLDKLVTPFVSGIYAGDPERLSINAIFPKLAGLEAKYGSVMKGMRELKGDIKSSGLGAFEQGMESLPKALEIRLGGVIIKDARVTEVERLNGSYLVHYEQGGEIKKILTSKVVCALPAYAAGRVLSQLSDELSQILSEIEYAPIIVVHAGYKHKDVPKALDGFGCLVPRKERVRTLGSLFSSALFTGRSPEGYHLLTSFLGGQLDPEAIDLTNEDIMRVVQQDLSKLLGIKAGPHFACITRYTHAIAQYNIGHVKRINRALDIITNLKGLHLTGSYLTGISVAATIEHAEDTAKKMINS